MDTKKLRQKILDLAIHGKLVPQDPNDEPASVLLERIRAEKERLVKEGKIKKSKAAKTSDTPHYENVPFEVPEGWVWCKLGDLFDVVSAKRVLKSDWTNKGIPFYRAREIVQLHKDGVADKDLFITEKLFAELKEKFGIPEAEDIMISAVGSIGYTYIVNEKDSFYYKDASVLCMKNVNRLNSLYFSRLFESTFVKEQMYDNSKGTTVDTITIEKIRKYVVPFPPLAEQQRIVAEIEKWFALIAQIEQRKTDLQVTIKQAKSKILDLAIHGKLVPQDPNDEPASELLKRINPKAEITCDNGHYQNLPSSWSFVPMDLLCSLTDGEKQSGIERINLDVKFLRGEREAKTLTSGKFTPINTLLILVDGENSGEVFRAPIDGYQGSTFKQLSINDNMNTDYMLQIINLHRQTLKENKVGSAIPHLNKKLFKAIEVPVPPYKEQQRIVEAINIAFKHFDTIMESL